MRVSPAGALRLVVVIALALAVVLGLVIGAARPDALRAASERVLEAARSAGPVGVLGFVALQFVVAASGILPASILGVAAGAAYGATFGFLVAATGTMAGALVAFALARSLFRDAIARQLQRRPRLARFDALLAKDGWRVVCLLRMSPVMPFAATSYALGLSGVGRKAYLAGTLASLPALFGYVYVGTLAGAEVSLWAAGAGAPQWFLLGLGLLATLVLTLLLGRLAQRALAQTEARAESAGLA